MKKKQIEKTNCTGQIQ